jgi:dynein heavy chain
LVDEQTVGDWNMEGLPADDLSIQNGIMVTRSSRFPLMIDPQSQAISWIKSREPELEQQGFIFTLGNPNLRDALKLPLMDGGPVLIENVENEVDPMLDPLLEKQISVKGRNKLLKLGDQEYDYDDKFRLYMTSRMSNPLWSPELAAKTTIIDFAVTITGLEQQLLGRLISREQKQLEDQLNGVKESVNLSKKTLAKLEADLLERLANAEGSLLDDVELIDVLGNIKTKSAEVKQSLEEATQTSEEIGVKREAFRPVAARGAVLYFCIVEMANVNWMYNVSLLQFLEIFYDGIDNSPKAQIIKDRVTNISYALTYKAYRYINRGIFERDKITFKLMMCLRILIQDGVLLGADVSLLLKAGAAIDDRNKKFNWLDQRTWNNIIALTKHKFGIEGNMFYKGLVDSMTRSSPEWRAFFESDDPENQPVPDYDDKINADQVLGSFLQFCLVRSFREDRTQVAANKFISNCLDPEFSAPVNDQISDIHAATLPNKPVLYLLSTGADPTSSIDDYARKFKKFPTKKTSMGEEMEGPALAQIKDGFKTGDWVILNNCHLSLEFMAEMENILNPKDVEVHEEFRLWITCAPDKDFPLGLLQMAIKVTMEPPKGMKAGLNRTFNTMVSQDFIEKVEPYEKWRPLTFAVCFLHSVVQERRKFGPIGFSMPYEFNASDLDASMLYMEKHMTTCLLQNRKYEWEAMQQMCCSIQYGGKITQEEDRALFFTYGYLFIREDIFSGNFVFNQQPLDYNYTIPDFPDHASYLAFINAMPAQDNPLVFGLNPNADLTASLNESRAMIATLIDTQPSDAAAGGGKSPEQTVKEIIENEFLKLLPEDFKMLDVEDRLKAMKHRRLPETGKSIPLVMFLFQEIQRFQNILGIVRKWMTDMCLAIDGQIIMSPEIAVCIKFIFDLRVPTMWLLDPSGAEIAWLSPTLSGWLGSLQNRYFGLSNWLAKDRPISFWLTGFFNPQGFLTSVN